MSLSVVTFVTVTAVVVIMHFRNVHAQLRSQRNTRYNSIHSAGIEEVHEVPLSVIIRPFEASLEERKLNSLIQTIRVSETRTNEEFAWMNSWLSLSMEFKKMRKVKNFSWF